MIEAASDVNKVYEEENEKLRAELAAAQDELAAVKQQQLSLSQVQRSSLVTTFTLQALEMKILPLPTIPVCRVA